MRWLKKLAEDL